MATIKRFEDLEVWQMARDISKAVYDLYAQNDPFSKDYKLKDQINGSSGSVMDNIAEGFERGGNKEFINFLSIAKGSLGEVKSQLYRAYDRDYVSQEVLEKMKMQCDERASKIGRFINYLNQSKIRGNKFKNRS
ncbi:MAG TPA: four helix bundle protein [Balneolales bacterium]|nr:four helix bundle protein [Balneolales bacterium]